MEPKKIEHILTDLLSTGGDFAEVFYEDSFKKNFSFIDNCLDKLNLSNTYGVGLRLAKENNIYYASTNDLSEKGLSNIVTKLKNNLNDSPLIKQIKLQPLKEYQNNTENKYTDTEVKEKLREINDTIRSLDDRITQVSIIFLNELKDITIANHTGLYKKEKRIYSRIYITAYFKDKDKVSNESYSKGLTMGNGLLDLIDYDEVLKELVKTGIDKLYAKPCIGKVMPVIIESGFGAVIFHEACGHAMEATSVADGLSVLSDSLGKQIASPKVTIIDDGSLKEEWGSTQIDDEGHETQKNVLIKDGVLVNYLIDELNNRKMKLKTTGSSRREDYTYAPTSRMNNTYLAPGTDTLEDMLKDIKLGLYAKEMGGGQVSIETGDFNFSCSTAYMIRDGKICECVKSASLIGNTKDILKEVEMVGSNLELGQGICGSISGNVPVNVGQPTIKIAHILVGGEQNE